MGTLFLVATPIGNLEDITLRAIRVLGEVALIAAEDTRDARLLLAHHGIRHAPLVSYNEHNREARIPRLIEALDDGDVALVSDAGMPGISDPGHELVVAATAAGHAVVPIPGASAVIAAVAASGLPSRRYHYLGFLPRTRGARRAALEAVAGSPDTLVLYESPHRLGATLEDTLDVLGDRAIAVCRELTKLHEEIWRGTVSGAREHFTTPRGEFTLVVAGAALHPPTRPDLAEVEDAVREMRSAGVTSREGVAAVAERFAISRRDAYRLWHGRESTRAP
jgi:16S rRNA (cytidine1402-2'-O)-methyltransferase